MKGFSPRNLKYMRALAEAYPDEQFVQQLAAQIPWGHNVRVLDHVKDPGEREWYIRQTSENGWSRNVLVLQIESGLYQRQGKAVTNFAQTLPAPQSDLAQQLLKDPYNFDVLSLGRESHERDLERGLLENLRDFLLELGVGFAFAGNQYHLEVGGRDFYLDLLLAKATVIDEDPAVCQLAAEEMDPVSCLTGASHGSARVNIWTGQIWTRVLGFRSIALGLNGKRKNAAGKSLTRSSIGSGMNDLIDV